MPRLSYNGRRAVKRRKISGLIRTRRLLADMDAAASSFFDDNAPASIYPIGPGPIISSSMSGSLSLMKACMRRNASGSALRKRGRT
jgi:hypothetical protein